MPSKNASRARRASKSIQIQLSGKAEKIVSTDQYGKVQTLFTARTDEIDEIQEILLLEAFDQAYTQSNALQQLDIIDELWVLKSEGWINHLQFNEFSRKIVQHYNQKLLPFRQLFSDLTHLVSLGDEESVNTDLDYLLRKLKVDDESTGKILELTQALRSIVINNKITKDADLIAILQGDIAIINSYQKYRSQLSSPAKDKLQKPLSDLVLHLRKFVRTHQVMLFNSAFRKVDFEESIFKRYMIAYAANDFALRTGIMNELNVQALSLASLFPPAIVDLPLLTDINVLKDQFEDIQFGFSAIPESQQGSNIPETALSEYDLRKRYGESRHAKKLKSKEISLRKENQSMARSRDEIERFSTPCSVEDDFAVLDTHLGFSDHQGPYSVADDLTEEASSTYSSDSYDSGNEFEDNFPSTADAARTDIRPARLNKSIILEQSDQDSTDEDALSSDDEISRSFLTYYNHKQQGVIHRQKKEAFNNPKYARLKR